VNEGKFYFYTQNSGKDTTKSPLGMFPAYAIDNDLEYVADKIRNFYEVGEYKSDDDMEQADAAVAAEDVAQPSTGRRGRGKTTSTKVTPPTTAEEDAPATGRSSRNRKTHDEVVAENQQKMEDYQEKVDEAIDKAAGDREEIPFEEAAAAVDTVEKPELETPPRRTRKERQAAEPVQDGTDNTDSVTVVLEKDSYFFRPSDGNYLMKHKGDSVDLVVGGETVLKEITQEQFGAGVKAMAQGKEVPNPIEGAMNPPEKGRRTRRSQPQEEPTNAGPVQSEEPEQAAGTSTRRSRRPR
jgi:hypothetical protein